MTTEAAIERFLAEGYSREYQTTMNRLISNTATNLWRMQKNDELLKEDNNSESDSSLSISRKNSSESLVEIELEES